MQIAEKHTLWPDDGKQLGPVVKSIYSIGYSTATNSDGAHGNYAKSVQLLDGFDAKNGFTATFWLKRANGNSSPGYIFYLGSGRDGSGNTIELGNGKGSYSCGVGSSTFIDPGSYFVCDSDEYGYCFQQYNCSGDANWHHWAVCCSGSTSTVYKDGVLLKSQSSSNCSNVKPALGNLFLLGRPNTYNSSSTLTRNLNGYLTRVVFLPRVASAEEIAADFNLKLNPPSFNGMSHYWDMEIDDAGILLDKVGSWNLAMTAGISQSSAIPV